MAGEIWRSQAAVALEVTPGTAVQPATRLVYWENPMLSLDIPATPRRSSSGRRDSVFAVTQGSKAAGGSMSMPMSADESLEILNIGVSGDPVITTPSGGTTSRLWTYKPSELDSATIEWFDGKRGWIGAGYRANTLTFEGSADGDNNISADLFGADLEAGTVTSGLTERDPSFIQGWQSNLYADSFAGTPGTTSLSGTMVNWNVQISNNLNRFYTSANTQAAKRTTSGDFDVTASITFDSDDAATLTEFNNWLAGTKWVLRLEFQDETGFIEGALRRFVTIDIPGAWTAVDLGGDSQGVRTYSLSFQSIYSSTLAAMVQVRVQCPRTAAF